MRASIILPVFAAAVFAQSDSSTSIDAHPQTSFTTQTDSRGVVTGNFGVATSIPSQPAVVTSQPAVATNVGSAASLPALGTGVHTLPVQGTAGVNSTQTLVVSINNSTTSISTIGVGPSSSSGASGSGSGSQTTGTGASGSGSGTSGTGAQSTGAAATMRAVAGSVVGVGAFVAAFL